MGLYSIPPQIEFQFKRSIVHDLLTIIGLLNYAQRIEGLSEWIHHTSGRIETQNFDVLNGLVTLNYFANGVHGYLVDALSVGEAATNFSVMMDLIEEIDPKQLQAVTLESIVAWGIRQDALPHHTELPSTASELREMLVAIQNFRVENWQSDPPPMSPDNFAALVYEPEALHEQFLFAFEYIWHRFYQSQWQQDAYQEQIALDYHQSQNYSQDIATMFRSVTGRNLPEPLEKRMGNISTVDLIPCCHVGAHVIVSIYKDKMWIGFNANLVGQEADTAHDVVSMSVAEYYPVLKALADESRLKIVAYLQRHDERNVGDIAEDLHMTISTVSRHLKLMARTSIVEVRREGTMRYYKLNPQTLLEIGTSLHNLGESIYQNQI